MPKQSADKIYTAAQLTPLSIKAALNLLNEGFRPVAGGTDLMVRNHAVKKASGNTAELPPIFSCRKIAETAGITAYEGMLEIGAAVTLAEIIDYPECPPFLKDSLLSIASPGIRNIATLAGNICNASPAADSLPALYCLDTEITAASLTTAGAVSMKTWPLRDFITGPGKTLLGTKALVTGIRFLIPDGYTGVFRKVGTRAANALSKLCIAAIWKIENNIITDLRLSAGACAPTIIRSTEAEQLLHGRPTAELGKTIDTVLEIYKSLINPIDDQRSTADYRRNTALKLIKNIILNAEI